MELELSSGIVATLAWEAAALYCPWVIMMGDGAVRGLGVRLSGLGMLDRDVLFLF